MIISYKHISGKGFKIEENSRTAKISIKVCPRKKNLSAIIIDDLFVIDFISWVVLNHDILQANPEEIKILKDVGFI